jgi:DNA-binding MarR family transcriptional regulator
MFRSNRLRDSGLLPPHYNYVIPICRNPGLSQEQLARQVYVDKYNVTRHLTRLEEAGYVERRPSDSDKRVMLVYPTQKMLDIYPKVKEIASEWNAYLTADIDPSELECFFSVLDKIAERAQNYLYEKEDTDK